MQPSTAQSPRRRPLSSADMASKFRWSTLKKMTASASSHLPSAAPSLSRRESEGLGMWDRNDDAFLQEVANESQQRQGSVVLPAISSTNMPRKSRPTTEMFSTPSRDPKHPNSDQPFSPSTAYRPSSSAGASQTTTSSSNFSATASEVSTPYTNASPESNKVELEGRASTGAHYFPKTCHLGWTEEPILEMENDSNEHEKEPHSGASLLERTIFAQQDDRWYNPDRRPSIKSFIHIASSEQSNVDAPSLLRYNLPSKAPPATASRSSSIISGLKKKLGGGSSKMNKEAKVTKSNEAILEAYRRGSAGLTPRGESALATSTAASNAPSSFASFGFPNDGRPALIRRISSKGQLLKGISQESSRSTSGLLKHSSIDSLSSRFLLKHRESSNSLHSRNSSRQSCIEHTSFDDARQSSFSQNSLTSSQLLELQQQNRQRRRGSAVDSLEEQLEEVHQKTSRKGSRGISPHRGAGHVHTPIRPSRIAEDSISSPSLSKSVSLFDRGSPDTKYCTVQDKRWSHGQYFSGARRGSDTSAMQTMTISTKENSALHKIRSVDGLSQYGSNRSSKATTTSRTTPGPLSFIHQESQRAAERVATLSKKQSVRTAQISRPTSVLGDSTSGLPEVFTASLEEHSATPPPPPPPLSASNSIRRLRAQEKRKQMSIAMQDERHRNHPRHTRSAGGRVEAPPLLIGTGGRSPTNSTFARMQQQQVRPAGENTRRVGSEPDATALFDCIPSPLAPRRERTKSTPTPFAVLLPSGNEESSASTLSPPLTALDPLPLTPDDGEALRGAGGVDCQTGLSHASTHQALTVCSPTRPIHADAPESPTEEVELLDEGQGQSALDETEDLEDGQSSGFSMSSASTLLENHEAIGSRLQSLLSPHTSPPLSKSKSHGQLKYFASQINQHNDLNSSDYTLYQQHTNYPTGRRSSYAFV